MDWDRLSQAIIDRRTALGYRKREPFAAAAELSSRLLADLEHNRRQNYDRVTIARVEQALEWEPGTVNTILRGGPYPGMAPGQEKVADVATELMTASGIYANLYAAKIELAHLIANSPLDAEQRFAVIREHRRRQNEFTRAEEERIRAEIEKLAGS